MKTPTQQAVSQLIISAIITAIIAGITAIEPYVTGTGPINYRAVGIYFALAVVFTLAHTLTAYIKALPSPQQEQQQQQNTNQVDLATLAPVLDTLITGIQQRMEAIYGPKTQAQQPVQASQVPQQSFTPTAQPVRPASPTATSMPPVQAQSGVQTSIPAFTNTAQYAVVQPNQAQQ